MADRGVWTQPTWTSHEDWADLVLLGRRLTELLFILYSSSLCLLLQGVEEAFIILQKCVKLLLRQGVSLLAYDAQARISLGLYEAPLVEGLFGHSCHACGDHALLFPC